jgi:hypothetical protein
MIDTAFSAQSPQRRLWPLFLSIAVGGLVTAVAFILVTRRSWPPVITPAVIGFLASLFVVYAIWQGQVRSVAACLVLAVLMSVLTYGLFHLGNYVLFRQSQAEVLTAITSHTPAEVSAMIDKGLREATGSDGFIGYLKLMLNTGMIVRSGMVGPANQVTGSSLLFYWFIDVGFILFGTLLGAWLASRRPFCEHCNHYYGRIVVTTGDFGLVHVGWLTSPDAQKFADLLAADYFESAGTLLKMDQPVPPAYDLLVERCFTCDTQPVVFSMYETGGRWSSKRVLRLRREGAPGDFNRLLTFMAIPAPRPTFGTTDLGWLLYMLGACAFIIVLLLGYSLI